MSMARLPDWEDRLLAFVEANWSRAFSWEQQWDCILMSCSAVEAQTGVDPAAEYRGRYTDKEGAMLALRELGKGTLIRTMNDVFPRRPVGKARRGDLVMFDGAAGVCMGGQALFVGEERLAEAAGVAMRVGLIAVPRGAWSRAWSVG